MFRICLAWNEYKIDEFINGKWRHSEYVELSVDTVVDMQNATARGGFFYCSGYTIIRNEED
jgi:hypothetical protein